MNIRYHQPSMRIRRIHSPALIALLMHAGVSPDVALVSNTSQWLMIDLSLISLDGSVCNMVGTGYTAFQFQTVRQPHTRLHYQNFAQAFERIHEILAALREPLSNWQYTQSSTSLGQSLPHTYFFL